MKHRSPQIENQIGKVLLQASEIYEIPTECFSYCIKQLQRFSDTKPIGARYGVEKCFIIANVRAPYFLEVNGAI